MLLIKVQPFLAGGPEGYPCPGKLDGEGLKPFPVNFRVAQSIPALCLCFILPFQVSIGLGTSREQDLKNSYTFHISYLQLTIFCTW